MRLVAISLLVTATSIAGCGETGPISLTAAETSVRDAPPICTDARASLTAARRHLVGLTVIEAQLIAKRQGCSVRVVEPLPRGGGLTRDLRRDRIDVVVEGEKPQRHASDGGFAELDAREIIRVDYIG